MDIVTQNDSASLPYAAASISFKGAGDDLEASSHLRRFDPGNWYQRGAIQANYADPGSTGNSIFLLI